MSAEYNNIYFMSDDGEGIYAYIKAEDGKWYPHNRNGDRMESKIFFDDMIVWYYDINAAVKKNGKWGTINRNGDIIAPLKYDEICYDDKRWLYRCMYIGENGKCKWDSYDHFRKVDIRFINLCTLPGGLTLIENNSGNIEIVFGRNKGKVIYSADKYLILSDTLSEKRKYHGEEHILYVCQGAIYAINDISHFRRGDIIEVFDLTTKDFYITVKRNSKTMLFNHNGVPLLPYWVDHVRKYYFGNSIYLDGFYTEEVTSDVNIVLITCGEKTVTFRIA